jgi:hypothetical protein
LKQRDDMQKMGCDSELYGRHSGWVMRFTSVRADFRWFASHDGPPKYPIEVQNYRIGRKVSRRVSEDNC